MRVLFAFVLCVAAAQPAEPFTKELWSAAAPVYAKTLDHPFLKGLADGTLPRSRFQFYLTQDSHYLRAFSQALHVLASKAPREEWAATLSRHAVEAIEAERALHQSVLASYGVTRDAAAKAEVAPSNYAYTNHLLASVERLSFGEGLAAVLPCYWIYQEVGRELRKRGSPNADYQRWISQYSDPAYEKTVQQVLAMMDAEATRMSPAERANAVRLFRLSARYEYLFWDMAWREERWTP